MDCMTVESIVLSLRFAVAILAIVALIYTALQKRKDLLHIFWGIFCGSLAIAMVKPAAGEAIGGYQYLMGLGACATCNAFWLVVRGLFRGSNSYGLSHILFAALVSVLIILREGVLFTSDYGFISATFSAGTIGALTEAINMLSPIVLALILRDGFIGWYHASAAQRQQRSVFIICLGICIVVCSLWSGLSLGWSQLTAFEDGIQAISAAIILIITHRLIYVAANEPKTALVEASDNTAPSAVDQQLASLIQIQVEREQIFLQTDLKVSGLAKALGVHEYLVSHTISNVLGEKNFNQFINRYRVDYAKQRLAAPLYDRESILAVALDSGFASVGPFNRAFKSMVGMTPSQYRKQLTVHSAEPEITEPT